MTTLADTELSHRWPQTLAWRQDPAIQRIHRLRRRPDLRSVTRDRPAPPARQGLRRQLSSHRTPGLCSGRHPDGGAVRFPPALKRRGRLSPCCPASWQMTRLRNGTLANQAPQVGYSAAGTMAYHSGRQAPPDRAHVGRSRRGRDAHGSVRRHVLSAAHLSRRWARGGDRPRVDRDDVGCAT